MPISSAPEKNNRNRSREREKQKQINIADLTGSYDKK